MAWQALREVEREKARQQLAGPERQDLTYLKNILLKLFETGALHTCPHARGGHLPLPGNAFQLTPSGTPQRPPCPYT